MSYFHTLYRTPLMLAVLNGHTECVYSLLSQGASVDNQDRWGRTALHRGVRHSHALTNIAALYTICCCTICKNTIFHFLHFHTGGDRPGGECGGSPAAWGQCVCRRHPGPLPCPPGGRLWPCGCPGGPSAGHQQHHLTHTPH